MSNVDFNQVVTRNQQDTLEKITNQLGDALVEVTGYDGDDAETMKRIMREKNIQVHKIINGPESGYHVMMGELHLKFIPVEEADGVLI